MLPTLMFVVSLATSPVFYVDLVDDASYLTQSAYYEMQFIDNELYSTYLYLYPSAPLPVYTAPSHAHPRVVRDVEVWFTGGYVTRTEHPYWYHLQTGDGFIYYPDFQPRDDIPIQSEADFCTLPPIHMQIEWYAPLSPCVIDTYIPVDMQPIARLYAYYAEMYRVNPMLAFAQAYHETGGFRSWWFLEHANPAGLYVTGARRVTPPSDPYWVYVDTCLCWLRGASFTSVAEGVHAHVALLARYRDRTVSFVAKRWAVDPDYERKWRNTVIKIFS